MKSRSRSRSSSSLNAPRMHPPPLVSAVSDPALNLNNNVLLAHLLTNSRMIKHTQLLVPEYKLYSFIFCLRFIESLRG